MHVLTLVSVCVVLQAQRFALDPSKAKFPLGFLATGLHCGVKKDNSKLDLGKHTSFFPQVHAFVRVTHPAPELTLYPSPHPARHPSQA